jgi:helix-turn-helix protein/DnaJ-like protein
MNEGGKMSNSMDTGVGGRQVTGSFVGRTLVGRAQPGSPLERTGPPQEEAAPGLEAVPAASLAVPPCEFPAELEVAMGHAAAGESGHEAGLMAPEASARFAGPRAVAPAEAPAETHYRVLGLPPQASREQIERAFRFCNEMYGPASLATYSLLEPSDVEATRTRIDEAYAVLMDPGRRRAYDENLGLRAPGVVPYPPPAEGGEDSQPLLGSEPVELPEVVTGPALKRVREMRGISLRQIATESKVGVRYLQYIEEDRFSFLPAPVYLRGFLAEYARVVGLDGRRVVESYIARIVRGRQ